ncbi:MAG: hypothetical protein JXA13_12265 [Anaerolineales bacterium]|nr:hypothetical protein [Anaerolineales bacterium]
MKKGRSLFGKLFFGLGMVVLILACGLPPDFGTLPGMFRTPTPTPPGGSGNLPIPARNRCKDLSGSLEMQLLVGPAEVVGLEPLAIGRIPFMVVPEGAGYAITGDGPITYQDVLEEEWGTYTVSFDLQVVITGTCQGDEQTGALMMVVTTDGEQLVEVRAEGYQGDFPWAGSHEFELSFPIEEGAAVQGEGWAFVLHVNE